MILPEPEGNLAQCRKWFQAAADGGKKWRREAKEDYEFTAGKQWTEEEIRTFKEDGLPAITINRILCKNKLTRSISCDKVLSSKQISSR